MTVWLGFKNELFDLKEKNIYRSLEVLNSSNSATIQIGKKSFLNFSSNNYLGLSTHPKVIEAAQSALAKWGTGSGASRLISGNLQIHEELEKELADFKGEEAATVFSSGYLANLGAVTSLLDERDVVLVDRLNHASLVDAARLSKAKLWVYPHRDVAALSKLLSRAKNFRRRLVLTDAYFSMDGDVAPLDKLLEVCRDHDTILMIDEAHSTGVYGKTGAGLSEHFGLQGQMDIVMGTLSKALGSVGGYIAGRRILREYLVNRSREFIYTTAPAPAASAAALQAVKIVQKSPDLRDKLWRNIHSVREKLTELGFDLMGSEGPVIPVLIGGTKKVLEAKELLLKKGIFAPAIRPPTVSKGTDRIRISLMATHTKAHLEELVAILKKVQKHLL